MNNLSDEQKMKFAAINAKFGLGPEEGTYDASALPAASLRFSSDPSQSDVPPHLITVRNQEELIHLMGSSGNAGEPTLQEHAYPLNVAYFASTENLTIGQLITVSGPDPVIWNYGNIEFISGGSLGVETDFTIYCQSLSKQS